MEKTTKRWKAAYEQPRIELCAAEPYKFLAASSGGAGGGFNGGHDDGGDDGLVGGAKSLSFRDPWESLDGESFKEK